MGKNSSDMNVAPPFQPRTGAMSASEPTGANTSVGNSKPPDPGGALPKTPVSATGRAESTGPLGSEVRTNGGITGSNTFAPPMTPPSIDAKGNGGGGSLPKPMTPGNGSPIAGQDKL